MTHRGRPRSSRHGSSGPSRAGARTGFAGRYIHAEHDDVDALVERADEIEQRDLNAIRLQR